jgi:phosphomannomutase
VKREVLDFFRQSTNEFLQVLYSWLNLSNQLVGDAYRNVLLTEASLLILDMPITHQFYEERCYENMKIYGLDRSIFEVGQEDRVVLKPDGIQLKINEMIGRFGGRVILRPSGTEDLVRLYIENNSKERIISMKNEILPILNSLRK